MLTRLRNRLKSLLRHPAVSLPLSTLMLVVSAVAVHDHATSIAAVKEQLLPASVKIPALEHRLKVLKQQLEVSELQASLRMQSPEEMLRTYVLPDNPDVTRLLATFAFLQDALKADKDLISMEPIQIGELPSDDDAPGTKELPLTLKMRVTQRGLDRVLSFIDMAGMLTVADAFGGDELDTILRLTEQENPAAITHLEQFLATDLKRYAAEPKPFEEQVFRAFSDGPLLDQLRTIIREGRLAAARDLLSGPLGRNLVENDLWPLRFLLVKTWTLQLAEKDALDVELGLRAYSR